MRRKDGSMSYPIWKIEIEKMFASLNVILKSQLISYLFSQLSYKYIWQTVMGYLFHSHWLTIFFSPFTRIISNIVAKMGIELVVLLKFLKLSVQLVKHLNGPMPPSPVKSIMFPVSFMSIYKRYLAKEFTKKIQEWKEN